MNDVKVSEGMKKGSNGPASPRAQPAAAEGREVE